MSILKAYFDKNVDQESRVVPDYIRKVNYDNDGNEFITYEEVDLQKFQESLGTVDMWSLDALLKAGIDPAFSIHTGLNTRLEGVGIVNSAVDIIDQFLSDNAQEVNEQD